jgi:acetyltransferase-like isoleucine patch superfamily enzyme
MNQPTVLQARIAEDVVFGREVKVVQPLNLYGCHIGDHCFIGPFVEIQKNVVIGEETKIQSHTFVCEMVSIGKSCFIGHGVVFINDLFSEGKPSGGDKTKWKPTTIGNQVSIGSNATILPVSICDEVVIGAGSVVTRDITVPGTYAGNPAKMIAKKRSEKEKV